MKRITAIVLLGMMGTALANPSSTPLPFYHAGFYLGTNIGYTNGNSTNTETATYNNTTVNYTSNTTQTGISGAFDMGYLFIRYLGLEAEYSLYPTTTISGPNLLYPAQGKPIDSFQEHSSTLDLLAKVILPFNDSAFSLYTKLGAAFFFYSHEQFDNISTVGDPSTGYGLAFVAGAEYKFTPHWSMNASAKYEGDFTSHLAHAFEGITTNNVSNATITPVSYLLGVAYQF